MNTYISDIGRITSLVVLEDIGDPNTWSTILKCRVLTDKGSFLVSSEPDIRAFYGYIPVQVGDDWFTCLDRNLIALLCSIMQDEKHVRHVKAGTVFGPLSPAAVDEVWKNHIHAVPPDPGSVGVSIEDLTN